MHAIEKLLAAKAGKASVHAGEIVNCVVDQAGINDVYYQTVKSFYEMGGKKVAAPEKVIIFLDHYAPCATEKQADNHRKFREFASEQRIERLMDINQGVCHQVMADHGYSYPGEIVVITDSHTPTHGAFGAFGTGVGATDLATIMATGKLWFRVPEAIRINFVGKLQKGVYAKDLILHVIGKLKADYAVYKAVEFAGPVMKELSVSQRMAMCNMTTEMGAKTSYIQPDEVTLDFLQKRGVKDFTVYDTDADYKYADDLTFDVTEIEPQLAAPFSVDNVYPILSLIGKHVDQTYLGSCTGGRVEDIAVAAQILKGKKIHAGTRMVLVPASRAVLKECIEKGYIQTLIDAGATLTAPGCGACCGIHQGLLAAGEVCVSSTNRNFPSRMGNVKGEIYLGSPASVAAAALEGTIADPRKYFERSEA
ncbi:3-isopropylmalate dehydratase large subunit [Pyramidobacter piscolens]|uniref:3-isopropylmalate dehydratase large subunit n=1 Tax=Pyramidobacter piscolens TaxID=638849 RepID=UPI001FCC706B|nr:3-isopropylmalate dehydratase large subunit [Pyramidobacter piscolens]BDF77416.1 3-isopropylmalate dehydratase large subunit [Pyramidobacter piscolens]